MGDTCEIHNVVTRWWLLIELVLQATGSEIVKFVASQLIDIQPPIHLHINIYSVTIQRIKTALINRVSSCWYVESSQSIIAEIIFRSLKATGRFLHRLWQHWMYKWRCKLLCLTCILSAVQDTPILQSQSHKHWVANYTTCFHSYAIHTWQTKKW